MYLCIRILQTYENITNLFILNLVTKFNKIIFLKPTIPTVLKGQYIFM